MGTYRFSGYDIRRIFGNLTTNNVKRDSEEEDCGRYGQGKVGSIIYELPHRVNSLGCKWYKLLLLRILTNNFRILYARVQ
jgi:hypothetical protein